MIPKNNDKYAIDFLKVSADVLRFCHAFVSFIDHPQ